MNSKYAVLDLTHAGHHNACDLSSYGQIVVQSLGLLSCIESNPCSFMWQNI
jgi:hypothetical protein